MSDLSNRNWSTLVERFFNDSSLSVDQAPKIVVLYGSIASGKSTMRRLQYAQGFVVLDAGEIFT